MRRLAFLHFTLLASLLGGVLLWHGAGPGLARAEAIDIDSLPQDERDYREAVEQYFEQVDSLIAKLKANQDGLDLPFGKNAEGVILELISLRDIAQRELEKFGFTEHGSFSEQDVRTYVNSALRILDEKYEKASDYLS